MLKIRIQPLRINCLAYCLIFFEQLLLPALTYQFYGSRGDRNLQIGNAVPTFLSNAVAKAILDNFKADNVI